MSIFRAQKFTDFGATLFIKNWKTAKNFLLSITITSWKLDFFRLESNCRVQNKLLNLNKKHRILRSPTGTQAINFRSTGGVVGEEEGRKKKLRVVKEDGGAERRELSVSYLVTKSIEKKTYSPESTMPISSATSRISRIVVELAHITITESIFFFFLFSFVLLVKGGGEKKFFFSTIFQTGIYDIAFLFMLLSTLSAFTGTLKF